jgi:hypothetical protein
VVVTGRRAADRSLARPARWRPPEITRNSHFLPPKFKLTFAPGGLQRQMKLTLPAKIVTNPGCVLNRLDRNAPFAGEMWHILARALD